MNYDVFIHISYTCTTFLQLKKELRSQEDGICLKHEPLNLVPWKLRLYWIVLLPVISILLRIFSKTCIQLSWHITTWKFLPLILCNQLCRIFCPNLLILDLVVIVFCGQFVFLFFFQYYIFTEAIKSLKSDRRGKHVKWGAILEQKVTPS